MTVKKGREYERRAVDYLVQHKYKILEQNYTAGHKEIDIIAEKERVVAFVEVKASNTPEFGHPAGWVNDKKQANLIEAAQKYIIENDLKGYDFRFDLITFFEGRLEHYPDAFQKE